MLILVLQVGLESYNIFYFLSSFAYRSSGAVATINNYNKKNCCSNQNNRKTLIVIFKSSLTEIGFSSKNDNYLLLLTYMNTNAKSKTKDFPKPEKFRRLIGPSFIILALGLGSGEVILWPYLASNYGLGLVWGAVLGITFQFFINTEIERYALVKGESVFVGINKFWRGAAYWFIFSTFIGFGLPGIIAASAKVASALFGWEEHRWLAVLFLVLIGVILSAGKTVYGLMEKLTKTIILIGVPFIFGLAVYLSSSSDWSALANGFVGRGEGFWFIAPGMALATFLAAFAYSGAGGNLNLTQSIYIREKGYGMGKYAQKIAGLFTQKEKHQKIKLAGYDFEHDEKNITNCLTWWRQINLEHLIVFWFVGLVSIVMLMLLAFVTTNGLSGTEQGISFILFEASVIGQSAMPAMGIAFLIVVVIMLFQTQLGVMDSTSRIMAENYAIKILAKSNNQTINLAKIYYVFLWLQISFGIILFLFNVSEPKTLLVLGAVINAFAMLVHVPLVAWLNHKYLPRFCRPGNARKIVMGLISLFLLCFFIFIMINQFFE